MLQRAVVALVSGPADSVYAHVNHLRPETFPKVEDNATLVLSYKKGVGLFEGVGICRGASRPGGFRPERQPSREFERH